MSSKLFIYAICAVAISGTSVWGQSCDNTYTGPLGGEWQEDTHWSLDHQPTNTEVACVPAGKTAVVYEGRCVGGPKNGEVCDNYQPLVFCGGYTCDPDLLPVAEAKAINISRGGEVLIRYCGNLIIHEDSTVNGKLSIPNLFELVAYRLQSHHHRGRW